MRFRYNWVSLLVLILLTLSVGSKAQGVAESFSQRLISLNNWYCAFSAEPYSMSPVELNMVENETAQLIRISQKFPYLLAQLLDNGFSPEEALKKELTDGLKFSLHQEGNLSVKPILKMLQTSTSYSRRGRVKVAERSLIDLSREKMSKIASGIDSSGKISFQKGTSRRDFNDLKKNVILLSAPCPKFPEGLTVMITGVYHRESEIVVATRPLTIEELLGNSSGFEKKLGGDDVESSQIEDIPEIIDLSNFGPISGSSSDFINVSESGHRGQAWEKLKKNAVFSSGISLSFSNSGVGATFNFKILDPVLILKKGEVSFKGLISTSISLGLQPSKSLSFKTKLLKLNLKPILLGFAGPVPIYIRPKIELVIKGRLTGSVGCGGTFSFRAPLLSGVRKSSGSWKNISSAKIEGEAFDTEVNGTSGSLKGKIFVGAYIRLAINDIAGPALRCGVYCTVQALASMVRKNIYMPKPFLTMLKIKGGAEASVGGAIEFLKNAELLFTIIREEIPFYKVKFSGLRPEKVRHKVRAGSFVNVNDLKLYPIYKTYLCGERKDSIEINTVPANWADWSGNSAFGLENLLAPEKPGVTTYTGELKLLDKTFTGRKCTVEIEAK